MTLNCDDKSSTSINIQKTINRIDKTMTHVSNYIAVGDLLLPN